MRPPLYHMTFSLAAIFAGTTAMADVTAQDVWDNWKANIAFYGEDGVTTASETLAGGTLTVTGLTLTADDAVSTITTEVGTVVFVENGDGTVSVQMQDSYPVLIVEKESGIETDLEVSQTGLTIRVSGDPGAMNYDVAADSYELMLADIRGADVPDLTAFARGTGLSGSYQTDTSTGSNTQFGFALAAIEMALDVKDEAEGNVLINARMEDLTTSGSWDLPEGADIDVPETFLDDYTFQADTRVGSISSEFNFDVDGEAGQGQVLASTMAVSGSASEETLEYNMSFTDFALQSQAPDLPVPVTLSMARLESALSMPTSPTEDAQPFGYRFALQDLSISDQIWDLADPSGALPRDPATFIFDIAGMIHLLEPLMSETDRTEFSSNTAVGAPFEPESITLNTLQLTAAGLEITAEGDFTFDKTDLETFDGVPRPEGAINVGITGANTLMDTLINMGVLPAQQATMGRMLMGMFTQPAGDDALTSKIEINDQGHVLANGQRIQ